MTPSVYFLPGLGADKRLFEKQLQAGLPITILEWKTPNKNESIQAYTERMAADIPQTDNLIIGGVSLGGIMAIEIAKIVKPKKVIIISSIKNRSELPALCLCIVCCQIFSLTTCKSLPISSVPFSVKWGRKIQKYSWLWQKMHTLAL